MISVLVASSSGVVRAGLASLVKASPGLEVVGHADGVKDLAERTRELRPDVVLLEAHAEELTGELFDGAPVVVLSNDAGVSLLRAGARGVLPADSSAPEIAAAIEAAAAGLAVLHPDLIQRLQTAAPPVAADSALTSREIEVLRMLAEGLANKEIAYRLGISEHTVKFHVAALFGKLNASSRTEAVTLGVRRGLILL